eukprot:gene6971-4935_t
MKPEADRFLLSAERGKKGRGEKGVQRDNLDRQLKLIAYTIIIIIIDKHSKLVALSQLFNSEYAISSPDTRRGGVTLKIFFSDLPFELLPRSSYLIFPSQNNAKYYSIEFIIATHQHREEGKRFFLQISEKSLSNLQKYRYIYRESSNGYFYIILLFN